MSLSLYDEAITKKISNWVKDPNLRILKPEEATRFLEMKSDLNNDKPLTLPLIAISRDSNIEVLSTQKQSKTFSGFLLDITKQKNVAINVIPIQIGYQIDIYTKHIKEADEYIRNFVFNLINYPKVDIDLPYNNYNITHRSNIIMESTITDNSNIKEHLFDDQFTRFSIKFKLDDAYLFSLPIKDNATIESMSFEVQDGTSKEIVESHEII